MAEIGWMTISNGGDMMQGVEAIQSGVVWNPNVAAPGMSITRRNAVSGGHIIIIAEAWGGTQYAVSGQPVTKFKQMPTQSMTPDTEHFFLVTAVSSNALNNGQVTPHPEWHPPKVSDEEPGGYDGPVASQDEVDLSVFTASQILNDFPQLIRFTLGGVGDFEVPCPTMGVNGWGAPRSRDMAEKAAVELAVLYPSVTFDTFHMPGLLSSEVVSDKCHPTSVQIDNDGNAISGSGEYKLGQAFLDFLNPSSTTIRVDFGAATSSVTIP